MSKESKVNQYAGEKLKELRNRRNLTQQELADDLKINQQQIARYENGIRNFKQDFLFELADYFQVSINYFFPPIQFDNADLVDLNTVLIKIPIYGTIKAGMPIDAQQDILEYVEIPEDWIKGGKRYYGLKISGDSMAPEYIENDIVIFQHVEDFLSANGEDCAVMVNGFDATFKKVSITPNGIMLTPININNSDGYSPTFYDGEAIQKLPVRIVGIAKEVRRKKGKQNGII